MRDKGRLDIDMDMRAGKGEVEEEADVGGAEVEGTHDDVDERERGVAMSELAVLWGEDDAMGKGSRWGDAEENGQERRSRGRRLLVVVVTATDERERDDVAVRKGPLARKSRFKTFWADPDPEEATVMVESVGEE
ncbi:hypothetical protein ACJZ2D_006033 [Fusarium nematophilum]